MLDVPWKTPIDPSGKQLSPLFLRFEKAQKIIGLVCYYSGVPLWSICMAGVSDKPSFPLRTTSLSITSQRNASCDFVLFAGCVVIVEISCPWF